MGGAPMAVVRIRRSLGARRVISLAAATLLKKLAEEKLPDVIKVDPELVVRESTGQVRSTARRPAV